MSMSFGLAATLSTSQKLTPQMQQAIKLLQLSSLELAQEVQAKLDSNPLLERIEDDEEYLEPDAGIEDECSDCLTLDMWNAESAENMTNIGSDEGHVEYEGSISDSADLFDDSVDVLDDGLDGFSDSLDMLQQSTIDNDAIDDSMLDNDYLSADSSGNDSDNSDYQNSISDIDYSSFDTSSYSGNASSSAVADFDELDSYQGSTSATIQDHVRWQLNFKRLSDTDTVIAEYLVDSMDDMGFVQLDIDELLQTLNTMASFYQWEQQVEREEIEMVLHIIQSCDPLGVGARNLSECLTIQLAKLDPNTEHIEYAYKLLSASEYLVSNNIKALTETTGLAPAHITPALALLRTLNPAPGLAFQNSRLHSAQIPESYDIPDVLVTPIRYQNDEIAGQDGGWHVRLNPETLPKLRVNQEYASLVKRGDDSPDNQYLRENLTDARLFIRSIEERNQNLLKVASSIVRRQDEFLQQGATAMQPLILKEVAEEVGLHESTVSRLTTSKSILTPQGLFSLKYFFSSHVSSNDGDISSTAISAMIKQLITDEDPKKPLSDSRIQAQLLAEGIDIARRTVAKYREAMNISSSTQRKKKY